MNSIDCNCNEPDRREIYLRWRGKTSGPFLSEEICRMFSRQQINKFHEVSNNRVQWRPLHKVYDVSTGTITFGRRQSGNKPENDSPRTVDVKNALLIGRGPEQAQTMDSVVVNDCPGLFNDNHLDIKDAGLHFKSRFKFYLSQAGAAPWVIIFGILPLAISVMGLPFSQSAWLFSSYFCVLWALVLGSLMGWQHQLWRQGILYGLFTAFIGIAMLTAWSQIPFVGNLMSYDSPGSRYEILIGSVFGVGLFEELCKATPLILFGLRSSTMRSSKDGLFLGMMSGLGFAMSEGVVYTLEYWSSAAGISAISFSQCMENSFNLYGEFDGELMQNNLLLGMPALFNLYGRLLVAQLVRFMTLPVLHAVWAGIVGYALAQSFLTGRWALFFAGWLLAACFHGIYNFNVIFDQPGFAMMTAIIPLVFVLALTRQMKLS